MKRLLKFLLPVLIIAIGVGGYLYLKKNKPVSEDRKSSVTLPVVAAQIVSKEKLSPTVTLFGEIDTPNNSVLTAGLSADVLSVGVLEGDSVEQGQVLVELDPTDVELDILQRRAETTEIEAQLESDRKKFESDKAALKREADLVALSGKAVDRARTLAKSSAGTEATLDDALQRQQQLALAVTQRKLSIEDFSSRQKLWKARLEKAKAALRRAERDMDRTRVKAPFTGRVTEVMVSPGDRAGAATQLVRLYDDQSLEVRSQIPSRYVPRLQEALDSSAVINAVMLDNGNKIPLTLQRLAASVSRGQGGVDAFFRTQDKLPALGKTVEIQMQLPEVDNAVALSTDALYGTNLVYRIEAGVLRPRKIVRLGQRINEDGGTEMLVAGDTFENGDSILNSRLPQAIDGLEVTVAE